MIYTFRTPKGNFLRLLYNVRELVKISGYHFLALPGLKTKIL